MNIQDFIVAAQAFANLGSAVNGQLTDIVEKGEPMRDQNSNALDMISTFLWSLEDVEDAFEFATDIDEYLTAVRTG